MTPHDNETDNALPQRWQQGCTFRLVAEIAIIEESTKYQYGEV
jgi:hypothetical protein